MPTRSHIKCMTLLNLYSQHTTAFQKHQRHRWQPQPIWSMAQLVQLMLEQTMHWLEQGLDLHIYSRVRVPDKQGWVQVQTQVQVRTQLLQQMSFTLLGRHIQTVFLLSFAQQDIVSLYSALEAACVAYSYSAISCLSAGCLYHSLSTSTSEDPSTCCQQTKT